MVFYQYGGTPPPFRRIGNFRFFPRLFSCFFWNFKMIIYAPWNRFCMIQRTRLRSTGLSTLKKEEKKASVCTFGSVNNTMKYIAHQSSKIWSYVQKYYTNNGILCVKRAEKLLSGVGDKSVRWGGNQKILDWGTCLDWGEGGVPLDGYGPQSTHTPYIGQP